MSATKTTRRQYTTHDASMLQFANVIHFTLVDNLADFTAFDAQIDMAYCNAYLAQITAVQNTPSNTQLKAILQQATHDTNAKAADCRAMFQNMKYFIQKAFPANAGVWAQFGFNGYKANNTVIEKLIQFMNTLHETSLIYQTQLTAVGFSPAQIAQIDTLANQLLNLNTLKNGCKGNRTSSTSQRTQLLNTVWATTLHICYAGKTLYYNNYGKWQLFTQPWHKGKPRKKKEIIEEEVEN